MISRNLGVTLHVKLGCDLHVGANWMRHGFLLLLARSFINTFGITQPGPEGERRAAYFIGALLALIVASMVIALMAFLQIRH